MDEKIKISFYWVSKQFDTWGDTNRYTFKIVELN